MDDHECDRSRRGALTVDQIEALRRRAVLFSRECFTEPLNQIFEALEQFRDGSYGTCAECGEAIGWARLRVIRRQRPA
jgi:hypothetical protein